MTITEVRITLACAEDERRGPLLAYASMVLDNALVIRDVKIIRGERGPFLSMPSRPIKERCPECGVKNHRLASWCNRCGLELEPQRATNNRPLHVDVCHPINEDCRRMIQDAVMAAYRREVEGARIA